MQKHCTLAIFAGILFSNLHLRIVAESNGPARIRGAQCMLGEHVPFTQHAELSFPSAKRNIRKMQKTFL